MATDRFGGPRNPRQIWTQRRGPSCLLSRGVRAGSFLGSARRFISLQFHLVFLSFLCLSVFLCICIKRLIFPPIPSRQEGFGDPWPSWGPFLSPPLGRPFFVRLGSPRPPGLVPVRLGCPPPSGQFPSAVNTEKSQQTRRQTRMQTRKQTRRQTRSPAPAHPK